MPCHAILAREGSDIAACHDLLYIMYMPGGERKLDAVGDVG